MTFVNWQSEDLENGTCTCGHKGPISDFRKSTREILALTRGRVLGAIEALSLGIGAVSSLTREMMAVFDPKSDAIAERAKTREGHEWDPEPLDRLNALADLIKARLQNLKD